MIRVRCARLSGRCAKARFADIVLRCLVGAETRGLAYLKALGFSEISQCRQVHFGGIIINADHFLVTDPASLGGQHRRMLRQRGFARPEAGCLDVGAARQAVIGQKIVAQQTQIFRHPPPHCLKRRDDLAVNRQGIIAVGQLGDQLRPVGPEEMDDRIVPGRLAEPGQDFSIPAGFVVVDGQRDEGLFHRFGQERIAQYILAEIHAGRTARYLLKQEQDGKILLCGE